MGAGAFLIYGIHQRALHRHRHWSRSWPYFNLGKRLIVCPHRCDEGGNDWPFSGGTAHRPSRFLGGWLGNSSMRWWSDLPACGKKKNNNLRQPVLGFWAIISDDFVTRAAAAFTSDRLLDPSPASTYCQPVAGRHHQRAAPDRAERWNWGRATRWAVSVACAVAGINIGGCCGADRVGLKFSSMMISCPGGNLALGADFRTAGQPDPWHMGLPVTAAISSADRLVGPALTRNSVSAVNRGISSCSGTVPG